VIVSLFQTYFSTISQSKESIVLVVDDKVVDDNDPMVRRIPFVEGVVIDKEEDDNKR
jgi:hypothetical protein